MTVRSAWERHSARGRASTSTSPCAPVFTCASAAPVGPAPAPRTSPWILPVDVSARNCRNAPTTVGKPGLAHAFGNKARNKLQVIKQHLIEPKLIRESHSHHVAARMQREAERGVC
eukprot:scaffold262851_cov30-Tisochrysis_lutea.AAC.2